jgi:glycerol-3-phosphate O-acyltransferase
VYPFIRQELTLRWEEEQLEGEVAAILLALAEEGLLERDPTGYVWRRSRTGTAEAVQLSLLAQTTVQILERYYLVISMLLRAGSGRVARDELEQRCVAMASRIAMLYGLETPEFSDRHLFRDFIVLLLTRDVLSLDGDGKLTYDEGLARAEVDARMVLSEQIRNSVLQVTHT